MSYDLVKITTEPALAPADPGSGFYHHNGVNFISLALWIGEVPSNLGADRTFESYPIGEGVPAGWEGLVETPYAEGATYSVVQEGLGGSKAGRLKVGTGSSRHARLRTLDNFPADAGERVKVAVSAKTSDPTRGYLRIDVIGDGATGSSKQFKLTSEYQTFEFYWVVPTGVASYNAAFLYGGLEGTLDEVAPGSYADIDGILVGVVADSAPGPMRNVVGSVVSSTTGRISDTLPWNDGGTPITGIRRGRNDPTGTLGGPWSTIDTPDTTFRDFQNLAPGVYEFTTAAINALGEGPTTTVTVDLTKPRDVTKHPYRGSWTSGAASGTWSHWNTPIGSGADLQPSGLEATVAGGKTISGTIRIDPIHIGYADDPIKTLSAAKKDDGTTYEQREPWKSGGTELVHVDPADTGPGDYSKGNSIAAFAVANDGTRVWQGHPLKLVAGGDPTVRYVDPYDAPDDLYGTGSYGAHGGSHTTALSCIRQWEWESPYENAIQHAIGYNLWAAAFLRGVPQSETTGHRWPANSEDSYWNDTASSLHYGQHLVPPVGMKMGALLCLPANYTWDSTLPLNTRKVLRAMRDFGLVVVDDSAWEVHQLSVEWTISFSSLSAAEFHTPVFNAIKSLKLVQNNTVTTPGGGGTPRANLVPDVTR